MTVKWDDEAVTARIFRAAQRGIIVGTERTRSEAIRLILDTPKTGWLYFRAGISKVSKSGASFSGGHRASAPGEAPASDTGTLVSRINVDYSRLGELVGIVRSSAEHAPYLEYGTAKMEPRPHMRPALANQQRNINRAVAEEIRRELAR